MSESLSVLPDASFHGLVQIRETGLRGMITVRGEIGSSDFKAALMEICGVAVPASGQILTQSDKTAIWMSPDELLLLMRYDDVATVENSIHSRLKGSHYLAANVSDARAVFSLVGPNSRQVLAKLCPADLSPRQFLPGQVRRTRVAQVATAIWMLEPTNVELVCFRSVAEYVFDVLKQAAVEGTEVWVTKNPSDKS